MKICERGEGSEHRCNYRKCHHYKNHEENEKAGHFCKKDHCGEVNADVECIEVEDE